MGQTEKLQIYFAVVNDGDAPVNPKIESSHFFINGAEPKDWPMTIGNGLRTSFFNSLPPGRSLPFSYVLGALFREAGNLYGSRESIRFGGKVRTSGHVK